MDDEEVFGVDAISLVENPAMEEEFVHFDDPEPIKFKAVNEEKQIVIGAILVPNRPVPRKNKKTGEMYAVYLKPRTVEKAAHRYLKRKLQDQTTVDHEDKVGGSYLVESWIVSGDQDKSKHYGLDYPKGTWVGLMKIENEAVWKNYVKTGRVKGFSIEGFFDKVESSAKFSEQSEMSTFDDYPESVKKNAKRGIELNKKNGNKCATQTGKIRAQQLANGEPISLETVARMHSYLSRAESNYDPEDENACGTISYLLWGGKEAKEWCEKILEREEFIEELEGLFNEFLQDQAGQK